MGEGFGSICKQLHTQGLGRVWSIFLADIYNTLVLLWNSFLTFQLSIALFNDIEKRTWAGFMWDTKSVFEERPPGNENHEIENGWSSSPDIGHDYFATLRKKCYRQCDSTVFYVFCGQAMFFLHGTPRSQALWDPGYSWDLGRACCGRGFWLRPMAPHEHVMTGGVYGAHASGTAAKLVPGILP